MEQPHLATEGKPFGVISTLAGNSHYNKHHTTDCTCRLCLANEFTVNDPFCNTTGSEEGGQ